MEAYKRVAAARAKGRPTGSDFIEHIFEGFVELHGDRRFADDKAIVAGVAMLNDMPVTVIAIDRGKDTKEKIKRNFGSAHPEGYRKALRQMKLAEKFNRPVICFIDTSGAYCGIGAEERGQAQAIAENLMEMMTLKVPIISIFTGEGESGGALGLAVADEVWMLENAVYSVISPEGCASILWKDASKTKEASECLKLTAEELLNLKVVERSIREPKDPKEGFEKGLPAAAPGSVQRAVPGQKAQPGGIGGAPLSALPPDGGGGGMIRIVTDSTVNITKSEAGKMGLTVLPMGYTVDNQPYLESYTDCNGQFEPLLQSRNFHHQPGLDRELRLGLFGDRPQGGRDAVHRHLLPPQRHLPQCLLGGGAGQPLLWRGEGAGARFLLHRRGNAAAV